MAIEPLTLTTRVRSRGALRLVAVRVLSRIDAWYRRKYRLRPIGPVLLVSRTQYRGGKREFPDKTTLNRMDAIAELHFNNACIATLGEGSRQTAGVRFARLFRQSLRELALQAQSAIELRDVQVFHGITWFKPHGRKVGFVSEPTPPGVQRRCHAPYFRLLAWGFAPNSTRRKIDFAPRQFWITRGELLKHFGQEASDVE
jgi:hypothetical protein